MTSQIDSSFIGAGPVSKSSMIAALNTARDEISALQEVGPFFCGATGGTASAYTATYPGTGVLSLTNGLTIIVVMHATNNASATIAVDGLAAQPIIAAQTLIPTAAIGAGQLVIGSYYKLTYVSTLGGWVAERFGIGLYSAPLMQATRSRSAVQSIPDATVTKVAWDQSSSGYIAITAQTDFTLETGINAVRFTPYMRWAANTTGLRTAYVYLDSTIVHMHQLDASMTSSKIHTFTTPLITCTSANVFSIRVEQNSGGALDLGVASDYLRGVFVSVECFVT